MPNAVVMTGYGPPDVLQWREVPMPEPGRRQIRIRVAAAGVGPTDLAIRAGHLRFPLGDLPVLGYEVAGTVHAVGPEVSDAAVGDEVAALLFDRGGYAEFALASIWAPKPSTVSWTDAAAIPSSVEAAAGVLRQLGVTAGERLLILGGGGAVGVIATQLAVAQGVEVVSAVGRHDMELAAELGAEPVGYGSGLVAAVQTLGRPVDAVFDAAGKGALQDAVTLAGGPQRVITLSDPKAAEFGVRLSEPTNDRAPGSVAQGLALLAEGKLRMKGRHTMPMQEAAEAHRLLESGAVRDRVILTLV